MIVRQATQQDAPAIAAIWNAEIRDGVNTFNAVEKALDEIQATIDARGPKLQVAEQAGQVIGFATVTAFRGGVGYRHSFEHTIYLAKEGRGRGAGRALMRRIEAVAREADAHCLVAAVSGENPDAVAFHLALGFEKVAQMPEVGRKFGRWMDLILLQKIL